MDGSVFFLVAVVVVAIALIVFGVLAARKRREEMAQVAAALGLSFAPEDDYALADQYEFLDHLVQGSNRYGFNLMRGVHNGQNVSIFDYHYETQSTDGKGRRQTHHHYLSFFTLALPLPFPELRIYKEGFFSKVGQFLGYDDIDFESAEFSRKFCVRSKDKRFAYDVCNPRMIEYLLANENLNVEIERDVLALAFTGQISPTEIEPNLQKLVQIGSLIPDYLFAERKP